MFPQRKYIPDQYKEKCDFQSWEGVKVVPGLAEERGVFSTKTFSRGSIICNYGGLNVTESYAEKHMLPYEEQCNYLVELREKTCDGASVKVFVNFDPGKEKTFGQLLNHSSVHANVEPKIYLSESNKLDILFRAKRKIKEDEEIVWDYGSNFSGVNNCVSSCIKCLKKSKIMEIMKSKLYIILNIKL